MRRPSTNIRILITLQKGIEGTIKCGKGFIPVLSDSEIRYLKTILNCNFKNAKTNTTTSSFSTAKDLKISDIWQWRWNPPNYKLSYKQRIFRASILADCCILVPLLTGFIYFLLNIKRQHSYFPETDPIDFYRKAHGY